MIKKIINIAKCYFKTKKLDLQKESITHIDGNPLPPNSNGETGGGGVSPCEDINYNITHPTECVSKPRLIIKPGSVLLAVGVTYKFKAYIIDNLNEYLILDDVEWSVSDENIGTISGREGVFLGVSPGTVTITAKYKGLVGTASVTVLARDECASTKPIYFILGFDVSNSMSSKMYNDKTKIDLAKEITIDSLLDGSNGFYDYFKIDKFYDFAQHVAPNVGWLMVLDGIRYAVEGLKVEQSIHTQLSELLNLYFNPDGSSRFAQSEAPDIKKTIIVLFTDGGLDDLDMYSLLNKVQKIKNLGVKIAVIGFQVHSSKFDLMRQIANEGFFINIINDYYLEEARVFLSEIRKYFCHQIPWNWNPNATGCPGEVEDLNLFTIKKLDNLSKVIISGSGSGITYWNVMGDGMYLYLKDAEITTKFPIDFSECTEENPYILEMEIAGDKSLVHDNKYSTISLKVNNFLFKSIINWDNDFQNMTVTISPPQGTSFGMEFLTIGSYGYICDQKNLTIDQIVPGRCLGCFGVSTVLGGDLRVPGLFIKSITIKNSNGEIIFKDTYEDEGASNCDSIENINIGGGYGYGYEQSFYDGISVIYSSNPPAVSVQQPYDGNESTDINPGGISGGGQSTTIICPSGYRPFQGSMEQFMEYIENRRKTAREMWNDPVRFYKTGDLAMAYESCFKQDYFVKYPAGDLNEQHNHYFSVSCAPMLVSKTATAKAILLDANNPTNELDSVKTQFRGYGISAESANLDATRKAIAHAVSLLYKRTCNRNDIDLISVPPNTGNSFNVKITNYVPDEINAEDNYYWDDWANGGVILKPNTSLIKHRCAYENYYGGLGLVPSDTLGFYVHGTMLEPQGTGGFWNLLPVANYYTPENSNLSGNNLYSICGGFDSTKVLTTTEYGTPIIKLMWNNACSATLYEPKKLQGCPMPEFDVVHPLFLKPIFVNRIDIQNRTGVYELVIVLNCMFYGTGELKLFEYDMRDKNRTPVRYLPGYQYYTSPQIKTYSEYSNFLATGSNPDIYYYIIKFNPHYFSNDNMALGIEHIYDNPGVLDGTNAFLLGGIQFIVGMIAD